MKYRPEISAYLHGASTASYGSKILGTHEGVNGEKSGQLVTLDSIEEMQREKY